MSITSDRSCASQSATSLWHEYRATGDAALRDRLVLSLAPMVKQIVSRRTRSLPDHLDLDDFLSGGLEALIRSIDRFDPERGIELEQFVWTRIHGAVVDEARRHDWAPRSLRRHQRERERMEREFIVAHHRRPTRVEIAEALAITVDELRRQEQRAASSALESLNVTVGEAEDAVELLDMLASDDELLRPEEATLASETRRGVRDAMRSLDERERAIARMLYDEELTMREIGQVLGITESRVSQLHTRSKRKLRAALLAADEIAPAFAAAA